MTTLQDFIGEPYDTQREQIARRLSKLLIEGLETVGRVKEPFDAAEIAGDTADRVCEAVGSGDAPFAELVVTAAKQGCGIDIPRDRAAFILVVAIDVLNVLRFGNRAQFGP
jgi:hypothetical protein